MNISANILTRNRLPMLQKAIDSVRPFVNEIVVCDTGSTDGTVEWLKTQDVKFIQKEWVKHFGLMRNFVREHSSGDYILTIDDDMELKEFEILSQGDFYKATIYDSGYSIQNYMLFRKELPYRDVPLHSTVDITGVEGKAKIVYESVPEDISDNSLFNEAKNNLVIYYEQLKRGDKDIVLYFNLQRTHYYLGHYIDSVYFGELTQSQAGLNKEIKSLSAFMLYQALKLLNYNDEAISYLYDSVRFIPHQVMARQHLIFELLELGFDKENLKEDFEIIKNVSISRVSDFPIDVFLTKKQLKKLKKEIWQQ